MKRSVVLYMTPRCHLCHVAAEALRELGVSFTEVDASDDAERFLRTPIIEIDGIAVAEGNLTHQQVKQAVGGSRFRRSKAL
ncbi:MAG: glutaredoxin family protein [Actinomycetota bacterium]